MKISFALLIAVVAQEPQRPAAGGLDEVTLAAPAVKKAATIHIILEVQDRGAPSLFTYRRTVIIVNP